MNKWFYLLPKYSVQIKSNQLFFMNMLAKTLNSTFKKYKQKVEKSFQRRDILVKLKKNMIISFEHSFLLLRYFTLRGVIN